MPFRSVVLLCSILVSGANRAGTISDTSTSLEPGIYAAVLFGGKSTGGASNSAAGLFSRIASDTVWTHHYRPNLFTFGMAYQRSSGRWYIAGGNGLHRSTDRGRSWRVLTGWQTEEVLSVVVDSHDQKTIFISTPFGVFKSVDDGVTWLKKMSGMKKWFVQKIIQDQTDHRILYAACEDDLYRSDDGGEHWRPLQIGAPGILTVYQLPSDPKTIIVGTEDDGVLTSFDGGVSWQRGAQIPKTAIYGVSSTSTGSNVYAGGFRSGFWKSEDKGKSWSLLWNAEGVETIFTVFVHPTTPSHLIIGTSGQGCYESMDGGKTWREAGLTGASVRQIELYE